MTTAPDKGIWLYTLVEAVPAHITEVQVSDLLPRVSAQRRAEALRYRHLFGQYASLRSYQMLQQLLVQAGVIGEGDCPHYTLGEHGKPYLDSHSHVHFNLSHCKEALAVAISNAPVGIDVESIRGVTEPLLQRTMSPSEAAQVRSSDNPSRAFIELWTRKESLFKQIGTGITDSMPTLLEEYAHHPSAPLLATHVEQNYIWSVCWQGDGTKNGPLN